MIVPRINLVVLRVVDLQRTAAFYEVLGLAFVRHSHGSGPEHLAAEIGGVVFELYPATATQPVTASARLGFSVEDVDGAVARSISVPGAKLVSPVTDSEWGRRAVVADPDGHRVEIVGL